MADPKKDSIINIDRVRPLRTPGQKRQRILALVIILIIAVIAFAGYRLLSPPENIFVLNGYTTAVVRKGSIVQTTQASGLVSVPVQMDVLSSTQGYALNLYVAEGEFVGKGQVLAEIDVPDLIDELDDLQISFEKQQRTYKKLEQQNLFSVEKMQRELGSLDQDIFSAENEVARLKKLVEINATRKSELEKAIDSLAALEDQRNEKVYSLKQEDTLNSLEMQDQLANLIQLENQIDRLQEEIDAARIKSPMTGDVLALEQALTIPGKRIAQNATLFTIADRNSTIVELEISEQYAGLLTLGQIVNLTIGSVNMSGTLVSIGNVASVSSDGLGSNIIVKVIPNVNPQELLPGSSVVGVFTLGSRENVLIVPRGPYLTTGSQKTVYVIDETGQFADKQYVTFGGSEGSEIEVLTGLEEGNRIITSGYQNFITYNRVKIGEAE